MPHILMRLPYGRDNVPVESFDFEEQVDGTTHKQYLWGNAAYALGTRLTEMSARMGTLRRDLCQRAAAVPAPDDATVEQLWEKARREAAQ